MADDTRSAAEIERDLEHERSNLQNTIGDLQNTFSPDNIVRSISNEFRTHGGEIGRSVGTAVRDNPLALTLTGVGLAWLIFGQGTTPRARSDGYTGHSVPVRHYGESHGSAAIGPRSAVPAGSGPDWTRDEDLPDLEDYDDGGEDGTPGMGARARAAADRAGAGAATAQMRASQSLQDTGDSLSRGAASVRDGVRRNRDAAATRGRAMRDSVTARGRRLRARSSEMQARLRAGTEDMSDEARARIVEARIAALDARDQARDAMRRGGDRAADFYDEHPLAVGALALAVGAAIAGALPRSRVEDDYAGERSDALFAEAERVFREERGKLERVGTAAMDEARRVGEETRADAEGMAREAKDRADRDTAGQGTAADAAADRVEDSVRRVADAADAKAKEEDLGNPRT